MITLADDIMVCVPSDELLRKISQFMLHSFPPTFPLAAAGKLLSGLRNRHWVTWTMKFPYIRSPGFEAGESYNRLRSIVLFHHSHLWTPRVRLGSLPGQQSTLESSASPREHPKAFDKLWLKRQRNGLSPPPSPPPHPLNVRATITENLSTYRFGQCHVIRSRLHGYRSLCFSHQHRSIMGHGRSFNCGRRWALASKIQRLPRAARKRSLQIGRRNPCTDRRTHYIHQPSFSPQLCLCCGAPLCRSKQPGWNPPM